MAINLNQEPDYSPLVNTLIDKTRDGKLNWMPTAVEDTFIATAKGLQSYEIRRLKRERDFVVSEIEPNPNDVWEREAWELAGEPVPVRLLVKGKEWKNSY